YTYSIEYWQAWQIYRQIAKNEMPQEGVSPALQVTVEYLRNLAMNCAVSGQRELWIQQLVALAAATLPYLDPATLQELFEEIHPQCPGGVPSSQQRWLDLVSALVQRDFHRIVEITGHLLPSPDNAIPQAHWFLLKARLLSLFMTGNNEEFARSLTQHVEQYKQETLPYDVLILKELARDVRQ
ncbi:MAG: hypothetical protein ACRESK_02850, partial [Gammaproteobacteria bacterium]